MFSDDLTSLDTALIIKNLFRCLHFEMISDLLFNILFSLCSRIASFSFWHSEHRLELGLYAGNCLTTLHFIVKSTFFSFNLHTSFDNTESFLYFSLLKDFLWFAYRALNLSSVIPLYTFWLSLYSVEDISASYNAFVVRQCPFTGQLSLLMQLHSPDFNGDLLSRISLLWPLIMDATLGRHA